MNIEHGQYGQTIVTELVTDGREEWFMSEQFYGYSKRDCMRQFRQSVSAQGLRIVS